jgi:hypothetical protein
MKFDYQVHQEAEERLQGALDDLTQHVRYEVRGSAMAEVVVISPSGRRRRVGGGEFSECLKRLRDSQYGFMRTHSYFGDETLLAEIDDHGTTVDLSQEWQARRDLVGQLEVEVKS